MAQMSRNANSSNFAPCPEGTHLSALVDIVDCGWKEVVFEGRSQGLKAHVQLVWAINELNDDGKPFLVFDRRMKLSFDPKSSLYKRLAGWVGAGVLEKMLDDNADMDDLIGRNAMLLVEHREWQGSIFANVANAMGVPKGMSHFAVDPDDYTRRCLRPDWEEKKPAYSAFEFLPAGVVAGPEGTPVAADDVNPNSNSAQAARLPQKEVVPNEPMTRTPTAAEQEVITQEQQEQLIGMAIETWGAMLWTKKLKEFLGGNPYTELTRDSAAKVISDLREVKVSVADKVSKTNPKPVEEVDTQGDIFDEAA